MTAAIPVAGAGQWAMGLLIVLGTIAATLAGIAGLMDAALLPSLAITMLLGWLFVRLDFGAACYCRRRCAHRASARWLSQRCSSRAAVPVPLSEAGQITPLP